jgi:hypothetical protein
MKYNEKIQDDFTLLCTLFAGTEYLQVIRKGKKKQTSAAIPGHGYSCFLRKRRSAYGFFDVRI